MSEKVDGTSDHEKSKTQAVGASRIQAMKSFENLCKLIRWDSNSGIVHLDFQQSPVPATANEYSPTRTGKFQGVAKEIAQDALKQHGIAHDSAARRMHEECKTFGICSVLVVAAKASQNGCKRNRLRFDIGRMLVQTERLDQQIELVAQSRKRESAAV